MQQTNAKNSPRADVSYTFVAQGVTKKGDVCTHVGYDENEHGVLYVRVNGSTTKARLLEF